jgi:PKD repeat protein
VTATGGGGGGANTGGNQIGGNGGSSGGGSAGNTAGTPTASPVQGNTGGASVADPNGYGCGGGGGQSAVGAAGHDAAGGTGGAGYNLATFDSSFSGYVAAGGGGGDSVATGTGASGGSGVGGTGGTSNFARTAATGYGSGGGGAGGGTATGADGSAGIVIIRYSTSIAPVASFTAVNISIATNSTSSGWSGQAPFTMQFMNTSTGNQTGASWVWNYTPLGSTTNVTFNSSSANPIYTFVSVGNYSISLNVTNSDGSNISTQVTWINVTSGPSIISDFTANITNSSIYGMSVQFTDASTGGSATWNWSFGDGGTSTLQNPTYIYDVAKKYSVTLNVTGAGILNNTTTKVDYINLSSDTDTNVKSWLHWNGVNGGTTITGEIGPAWVPSLVTTSTTQIKFGNASGYFNNQYSKVSTLSNPTFNFGSGNFTIEKWLFLTSAGNDQHIISRTSSNAHTDGWSLYSTSANASSNSWVFYMGNAAANKTDIFTIPLNMWNHVVIERINGVITVYINGTAATSKTMAGNYDTNNPVIHGYIGGSSNSFTGYIDESRISTAYRWGKSYTPPVYEYAGNLYFTYPDTNSNSTLRFKTNPDSPTGVTIANMTPRYRTIQLQNATGVGNLSFTVGFNPLHQFASQVLVNSSTYNNLNITYSNIDNTIGEVTVNITRPVGMDAAGDTRVSLVDVVMNYYNYSPPGEYEPMQYFGYGYITNNTTGTIYPVHNFIITNVTFLPWDFFPNFTVNKAIGFAEDILQFNETTVGYPNTWNYTWGDGTFTNGTNGTQSDRNVTHIYTRMGTYTVTLTEALWQNASVMNSTTKTDYITIYNHTIANFNGTPTLGFDSVATQFVDMSSNATNWNWTFGDGTPNSYTQSPLHTYTSLGAYTVTLNASNSTTGDFNITTKVNYIIVNQTLAANFGAAPLTGYPTLNVSFVDMSTGNGTYAWLWHFGDGTTSALRNPTHAYSSAGNYNVDLQVSGADGITNKTVNNYIIVLPQPPEVSGNSMINFTQSIVNMVNATPLNITSVISNMSYNVSYVIGNISFDNLHLKPRGIVVNSSIYSDYNMTYSVSGGYINYTIWRNTSYGMDKNISAFSSLYKMLIDIDMLYYNYSNSTNQSIMNHTVAMYNTSNNWTYNNFAQKASTIISYDDVLLVDFSANSTIGTAPWSVQFNVTSNYVGTSWYWDFGDIGAGNTSTVQNATHTYTTNTKFNVSVSVTNTSFGVNTSTKYYYIDTAPSYINPNSTINFTQSSATIINGTPLTIVTTVGNMSSNISVIVGNISYDRSHLYIAGIRANQTDYHDYNFTFTASGDYINYTIWRNTSDINKISALNATYKNLLDLDIVYCVNSTSAFTINHSVAIYNTSMNMTYLPFIHSVPIILNPSGTIDTTIYRTNVSSSQMGMVHWLVNDTATTIGPTASSTISGLDIPENGGWVGIATGNTIADSYIYHLQVLPKGFGLLYSGSASATGIYNASGDVTGISTVDSAVFSSIVRQTNYNLYQLDTTRVGGVDAGGTLNAVDAADKNALWVTFGGTDGKLYILTYTSSGTWTIYYSGDSGTNINSVAISMRGEYVGVGRSGTLEYYNVQAPAGLSTYLVDTFVSKGGTPYVGIPVSVQVSAATPFSWSTYVTGVTDSSGKFTFSVNDLSYYNVSVNGGEYTTIYQASSTSAYRIITINIPVAPISVPYVYTGNYNEATHMMNIHYQDVNNVLRFNTTWYNMTNGAVVHMYNITTGTDITDSFFDDPNATPNSTYGNFKVIVEFTRTNGMPYSDTVYVHSLKMTKIPGTSEQMTIFKYALYTVLIMVIGLGVGSMSVKYGAAMILAMAVLGLLIGFLPWSIYTMGITSAGFIAITVIFRRNV